MVHVHELYHRNCALRYFGRVLELSKLLFRRLIGQFDVKKVNFHESCHGNCALSHIGGILEFRKLNFRGLKGQFDVKKANFRGVIAEIGYYMPILTSRTHLWPIFMKYVIGNFI